MRRLVLPRDAVFVHDAGIGPKWLKLFAENVHV